MLDTGRKLERSLQSREGFLRIGVIKARPMDFGKIADEKELFMI